MTLAFVLAALALVTVVALLAVGRLGELPEAQPDRPPLALPEDRVLVAEDVDAVRFAVGVRGYRMDEVDEVLDRLAAEVGERDARIAALQARLDGSTTPAAASAGAASEHEPAGPAPQ